MQTIWKYQLEVAHLQRISMQAGCTILYVANQDDRVTLWAEVDTEKPPAVKTFAIYGTGHPISARSNHSGYTNYIGTVQIKNLVWHIFEIL